MKRRTSSITLGGALAGLWIAFIGLVIGSAVAMPFEVIAAALERAVS